MLAEVCFNLIFYWCGGILVCGRGRMRFFFGAIFRNGNIDCGQFSDFAIFVENGNLRIFGLLAIWSEYSYIA